MSLGTLFMSLFAFIFQAEGQRCLICLSYEAAEQAVSCLTSLRHVNTMLPCEHCDLSKQQAASRPAGQATL